MLKRFPVYCYVIVPHMSTDLSPGLSSVVETKNMDVLS